MPSLPAVRRVAMLSVHTSPLARPGTGDAGGLNVYVDHVSRQLVARGIDVDIFTRATSGALPATVELAHDAGRATVHHIPAGPYDGLGKEDLPGQLCAFTAGVMGVVASRPEGWYDVVHSHYWLSGQVGWLASERWHVPLVHTMHTMARVKNSALAEGDTPEPPVREIGEAQVVEVADRLVANTEIEAEQLIGLYAADPTTVRVVPPGVDLDQFSEGDPRAARARLGVPADAILLTFVGRIQPLKAPDLLVKAAARLLRDRPDLDSRLRVAILGGPSGSGLERPRMLEDLAASLGIADKVRFVPPVARDVLTDWYRASDLVCVPSYNESFGLVALEAQACGTPVVAADVGGLPVAVGGGVLVPTHDVADWSRVLESLVDDPGRRSALGRRGVAHAAGFSWRRTTDQLLEVYREAMSARHLYLRPPVAEAG